ncbi:M48 family metalloprotease [Desulfobotulus mexicanus]|uniref:M48 family metalloprotease n=1 Tax=Desulfobotulus mexicanus TaxID=2586642 RepID=A0A5S5MFI0_9BACT|nr:M48 family metalloprotease [Desulfobotulus mexicanus]TYT74448.1 M48 family metalloprotease [Desulfobotulus mexicanus]
MKNTAFLLLCLSMVILTACKTMGVVSEVGTTVGVASGAISESQAEAIKRSSAALAKSFEDITPEQEYYIGRSVGATILSSYKIWDNEKATDYLNILGQTLALYSRAPETYKGYAFLILDSDEINAFAAPSGFIFITRGMLRLCTNETELAAVLAHEIAHVSEKHGLKAIKRSRLTTALTTIAVEGAGAFAGGHLAELTEAFGGSVADITGTLMTNGYSRAFEREADAQAIAILRATGYDPAGLPNMLSIMEKHLKPGAPDFASTHPAPRSRIAELRQMGVQGRTIQAHHIRDARFRNAFGNV